MAIPALPAAATVSVLPRASGGIWQTRRIQVPVLFGGWGFKSPLAHPTMASGFAPLVVSCQAEVGPICYRICYRRLGVEQAGHPLSCLTLQARL
jgi:hypothetical protein